MIFEKLIDIKESLHQLNLNLNFSGLRESKLEKTNIKNDSEIELTFQNNFGKKIILKIEAIKDQYGRAILKISNVELTSNEKMLYYLSHQTSYY